MDGVLVVVLLLVVIVVVPVFALASVAYAVNYKLSRRRLAHEWDGFHAWAERVGVTPSFAHEDDEWRGTLELGGVTADVSIDTNALDRRRRAPATLTLRAPLSGRAPEDLHVLSDGRWVTSWRPPSLKRRFALRGDEVGALAFLTHDLCRMLGVATTGTPQWASVEVTGRMLKFVWIDMFELLGDDGERRAQELFKKAARVLREVPDAYDEPALLAERAADPREPDEVRWRAGRALFKTFWKTPALESFVRGVPLKDDTTQTMCAIWGRYLDVPITDDARVRLLKLARDVPAVVADAEDALVGEYGWRALMSADLPERVRLRAARSALTAPGAPDEPYLLDDALTGLILSGAADAPRGDALLEPLMTGGWRPEERASLALARRGDARLQRALLEQLRRLGARPEDAPALAELANAGVSGARELLESLRGGAHGMLSLSSDDPSRGGLSQARGAGDLTPIDEDP